MSTSNLVTKTALYGALALACGLLYSTPAAAVTRSFYQNAGATCRGVDAISDSKLTRAAGRLMNNTSSSVDVVCELASDILATASGGGVVTYVAVFARPISTPYGSMSCVMTEGFFAQSGAATYQPVGGNPKTFTNGAQIAFSWDPTPTGRYFYGPISVRCTMPARSELDDTYVAYDH